jgi:glucose/arabinose dehydrogenase
MRRPAPSIRANLPQLLWLAAISLVLLATIRASHAQEAFDVASFVQGLDLPTSMEFAPDGRLFVTEKAGTVRVVAADGTLRAAPFVSINVYSSSERGLLSLTFDPAFATNGYVYAYYTHSSGDYNRVSRFTASASSPDTAAPGSELVVLDNIPAGGNHNAGALHFGPDGKLYVATGDTKTTALAQSLGSLAGKILRIDPAAYPNVVPADNPFVSTSGARGEVWAYGLRNPFTFAIAGDGRMFINDVGQYDWEEVNRGQAGANYGWPTCEGPRNTGVGSCTSDAFVYPDVAIEHPDGSSITGAVFYEATQFPPEYRDNFFFGDYVANWIWRLTPDGQVHVFLPDAPMPVDIDVDATGNLYYLSIGEGAVYRVRYGTGNAEPVASFNAVPSSGATPLTVTFDASASSDADGDALSYAWDFGDGATDSGVVVTHTYINAGSYTARLTVSHRQHHGADRRLVVLRGRDDRVRGRGQRSRRRRAGAGGLQLDDRLSPRQPYAPVPGSDRRRDLGLVHRSRLRRGGRERLVSRSPHRAGLVRPDPSQLPRRDAAHRERHDRDATRWHSTDVRGTAGRHAVHVHERRGNARRDRRAGDGNGRQHPV